MSGSQPSTSKPGATQGGASATQISAATLLVPSPDDTVVTGVTGSITDANGNQWTINGGGEVAINGVADTTTANVVELAYVNGTVWQKNSSKLWWGKTQPTGSWAPATGTATSPLPASGTVNPTPTPITTPNVTRDPSQTPFASDSVFDLPLGLGAQWMSNAQLASAGVFVNTVGNYNENIFTGTASDPLVTITNTALAGGSAGTFQVHIPVGAVPAGGNDQTFAVDDTVTHTWYGFGGFNWTGTNTATVSQGSGESDYGSGIEVAGSNWDEGVGTLRQNDLQAGTIDHMLRMELPTDMLLSYTNNISQLAPFAWPQSQEDGFALSGNGGQAYSGTVPYGVTIGIPANAVEPADVAANAGANLLWHALQNHGAMVRDSGGSGNTVIFQADQNVDPSDPLIQGMQQYGAEVMAQTQILANQGPNSVNGGGTPIVPLDPPPSDDPSGSGGTPTTPTPTSTPSPSGTVVTGTKTAITDTSGNAWTITSNGQVAVNGTADTSTANVVELAYMNGTIWQENSDHLWWGKSQPNASWSPATGTATSPLPSPGTPTPTPTPSANDTVVMAGSTASITDASGNLWTITSNGQVAINGTADTKTANVIELAYVNGTIWQENSSHLWWGETKPDASWSPAAGTAISPLAPAPVPTPTPTGTTFDDEFNTLSLHRNWQPGDNWQLIAPDSTDGRGGRAWNEVGRQWWVNPNNPNTPINGLYGISDGKLELSVMPTPAAYQTDIDQQGGAHLPYVGALLNTSPTDYQKYGYYELNVAVDRVPGFTFQADSENVQLTGHWPPEIDFDVYTDASNVQHVKFQVNTNNGNPSYTTSSSSGFDANSYHTYGWNWQSDDITFYIDGVQVWQTANPGGVYTADKQFLYLVTYANYPGGVDPDPASLPAHASVDYLRVYQNKPADNKIAAASPAPPKPSTNDTVLSAGSTGAIIDANGNSWTITGGGQVAVNGSADPATSNVIELVYAGQQVWQENASNLWWAKSSPTGAWIRGAGASVSPLPASIAIAPGTATTTITQSQVFVTATGGNHMVFLTGSHDTVSLSGGIDTITDTGSGNTYVLPTAGHGTNSFTNNILAIGDELDLRAALMATSWDGSAATLTDYLHVTASDNTATVSVVTEAGGQGLTVATIVGAGQTTLTSLLSHAIT